MTMFMKCRKNCWRCVHCVLCYPTYQPASPPPCWYWSY